MCFVAIFAFGFMLDMMETGLSDIIKTEHKLGFDKVRDLVRGKCSMDYSRRRTDEEMFSTSAVEISRRLELTDEMRMILMFEDAFPTQGFVDCMDFLLPLKAGSSHIDVISMGKLQKAMDAVRKVVRFFDSVKDGLYPTLKEMAAPVVWFPEVLRRIDSIIDRFGAVRDNASDQLAQIRRSLKEAETSISRKAEAILRRAQEAGIVDKEAAVSVREGKILIPVPAANKRRLKGFIFDESATGRTAFIEPEEVVELDNRVRELKFSEEREIVRILCEFTDFLRPYIDDIADSFRFLGEIDFIMAKASVAIDFIAGKPLISENGELNLRKARHPILERTLKKEHKEIVPLTITLTPQRHIMLISGPNAGGKSVCLKTVGLLQYMFQWGMLVPSSEISELPVFESVMVDIGDDQSIENDLSTYSSHLANLRDMLSLATDRTLVLIDEFGSGTEPAAGGAIAEAILAELDRRGVFGVITTHYTNLKLYASGSNGVVNGAMQFDVKNITPLFILETGLPGNSFAFELARKMGLPEAIVKDAEERAGEEFVGIERNLRRIARSRRALDEKLAHIKTTDKTLDNLTERYQKELETVRQMKKEILDQAKKEAKGIVADANKLIENTIRTIKESQADAVETKKARSSVAAFTASLDEDQGASDDIDRKIEQIRARREREAQRKLMRAGEREKKEIEKRARELAAEKAFRESPIAVGDKVRLKESGLVGEVTRISAKQIFISVGNISTRTSPDKIEKISSGEFKKSAAPPRPAARYEDPSIRERRLNFKMEIDVRGERVNDALAIVMHYIDDAIMLGVPSVRILHGKGTGALREEIQKYLKTVPGISSVKDEDIRFGGSGITVVTFD